MDENEWWDAKGMSQEVDNAAWELHREAETLPSQWKHIISSASALVLAANRKDEDGVRQFWTEIAARLSSVKS